MYRGCPGQSGLAATVLPDDPQLLWKFELEAPGGAAATIADDVAYVAADNGLIVALNLRTGEPRWRVRLADPIYAAPTVHGNRLIFGDDSGRVHCLDTANGKDVWIFDTQGAIYSSVAIVQPPVPAAPRAVFGSYDGGLYCLNVDTGERLWRYGAQDKVHGAPALHDGYAFVAACDGYLHCVRLTDGAAAGRLPMGAPSASSAAIAGDRLFFGTYGNQVLAVDFSSKPADAVPAAPSAPTSASGVPMSRPDASPSGALPSQSAGSQPSEAGGPSALREAWTFENPDSQQPFMSSAATDGRVVVIGGRDKRIWCFDAASGKVRWSVGTRKRVEGAGVIVGSRAYIGSDDGILYGLSLEDGRIAWRFESGAAICCGPSVAAGRMIVGNVDGTLFCFGKAE